MRVVLAALLLTVCGTAWSMEIPSGATIIYRCRGGGCQRMVLYRDVNGQHWHGQYSETGVGLDSLVRVPTLEEFRSLLRVDDYDGVMGSVMWKLDTDGDGFSDMLEYLTNGDPLDARVMPTDPEFLYFDDGAQVVPLLPYPDLEPGAEPEEASLERVVMELSTVRDQQFHQIFMMSFFIGLYMWRLVVLSKSQRGVL